MFTFAHNSGTNEFSFSYPLEGQPRWISEVDNVVTILVVEDDPVIQALVVDLFQTVVSNQSLPRQAMKRGRFSNQRIPNFGRS